ncbi:MAG: ABC transporter transmembrane domain-containing protein [Gemmatimonadota bacterium]|nr:ABC transporter transmembrane domain-containing protein [Gemmatimonadota bacterium]
MALTSDGTPDYPAPAAVEIAASAAPAAVPPLSVGLAIYRRLFPFLRPHAWRLVGAMLTNIGAALLDAFSVALLIPFLNTLFDRPALDIKAGWVSSLLHGTVGQLMVDGDKMTSLRNVIFVVMLVVIAKNFLVWVSGQFGAQLQEFVTRDLRNTVYRHLARLPLTYFTRTKSGQIISRVLNDTFETRLVLTQIVTQSLQAIALVVATIFFLFDISWKLSVMALGIVPILSLVLQPLLRKLRRGNRRRGNQHGEMASVLQETVSGIRLVKSFGAEAFEEARFTGASNTYARTTVRLTQLSFLAPPVTEVIGMMIAVAILWVGAREVLVDRSLTGADLITFLVFVLRLLQPLKQLTAVRATAQSSLASAERLFDILDTPSEQERDRGTASIATFTSDLRFEHVGFAYDRPEGGDDVMVLDDISFCARRGDVIALVGASGAGKTTLVDLIPRFYEPTSGAITIDGTDTRALTLDSLRSLIGIVSQDTVLFHDTVRNNVAYGSATRYSDAQVEAAARAANAHAFITALPDGYSTMLGERGTRLSGGQRQRIAIARALLLDPPILILDEATSALDTESERLVQAAIDRLLEGRTVFVIAHRLSTVQHASQILVLDGGRIVERGTHDELRARRGAYSRLYDMQFRNPAHTDASFGVAAVPSLG